MAQEVGSETERRRWEERKGREGGREGGEVLLVAAQQFHSQRDALMPRPWQDADESGIEGWLKYVLLVDIVVTVAGEDLQVERT